MQVYLNHPATSILTKTFHHLNPIQKWHKQYPCRIGSILLDHTSILHSASWGRRQQLWTKSQLINTLPKYHKLESEDAYFFIRKFEEVCVMMKMQQLGDDAVKLRFAPFALKDLAKKWLYSITSWDDFAKVFLKKFYPIHKIALIRKKYNAVQERTQRTILKILRTFHRPSCPMPSS